jgi:GT2 family glycosyltransferase
MDTPKASIIILVWNGIAYIEACLQAVLAQDYANFEVIVVDNASSDSSADFVAERFPQVKLVCNSENVGFSAGNNIGLRAATGDVLILLNQDTVVHEGWLAALVTALADPTIGLVGCKMLYPDGTIQHAGAYLYGPRGESDHIGRYEQDTGQYDQAQDVEFVTGASIALTRSTLVKIGPLDEGFVPAYYEDTDWCYRARQVGLRVVYCPSAVVTHHESTSIAGAGYVQKAILHYGRLRFLFKHKPLTWLQAEFAPAELDWAGHLGRTIEMMAARDAYLRLVLSLPDIFAFRLQPDSPAHSQKPLEEWAGLLALATKLRAVSLTGEAEVQVNGEPQADPLLSPGAELHWTRLQTHWQIEEHPFQSHVPVVGPGIAAFRQVWNNVSTRWYVLPMIQQQNVFNWAALNLMTTIARDMSLVTDQSTREINILAREVVELRHQLAILEAKLAQVSQK